MPMTPTPAAPRLSSGFDTGISNTDGITAVNTPTIVGIAAPGALVTLYDTDGTTVLGTATADPTSGGYTISIVDEVSADGLPDSNLDDGTHQLSVTATLPGQPASNPSAALAITIDTQAPDAPTAPTLTTASDTGASTLDGITAATILTLTGQSEPGAAITLLDGATQVGQAVAAIDGTYTITTAPLAPGAHSFTTTATDTAGNTGKPSNATAVTIDTAAPPAPAAPTLAPGSDTGPIRTDGLTSDTIPVVTGTAEAGATIRLTDPDGTLLGTAVANADGTYAIPSTPLLFGANELKVTATDAAGNVSAPSAPLNIVVQTRQPTAAITADANTASAGSETFQIHFDQPIADRRGITPDDFRLVTTGSAYGTIEAVRGSGDTGFITVDGLGGSGTIAVQLAADTQITDQAGNTVVATSFQSHDVDGTEGGDLLQVSAGPSGVVGPGQDPSASLSGRFVAFDSAFQNASGRPDVYVKDLVTGGLTKVSASLDGDPNEGFLLPSLSADARTISFVSLTQGLDANNHITFSANVYVAALQPADPATGGSVSLAGQIALVSAARGAVGSGTTDQGVNDATADRAFVSGDGSTVVFTSDQALAPGVIAGVKQVYAYDVPTGVISLVSVSTEKDEYGYVEQPDHFYGEQLVFQPVAGSSRAGTGGDFASRVISVSADGTRIAFESSATDLGTGPLPPLDASITGPYLRSFVYDTRTGTVTVLDGFLTAPAGSSFAAFQTFDPQLSADGSRVTYAVEYGDRETIYERDLATSVVTQLTPATSGSLTDGATLDADGGVVAYVRNDLGLGAGDPNQIVAGPAATAATDPVVEGGYQPTLTGAGNAVVFTGVLGNDYVAYEQTLGVTAGIGAVGSEDEIGAAGLAAIKAAKSVTFTGTTNAPVGSLVSLQVGAQGGTPGLVTTGAVTAPGVWTVVADANDLGADGTYIVAVTVKDSNGQSPRATRAFTLDTAAPDAPGAPALDPGSDTGLAHDGASTDTRTPTLTGTAEAGTTVTLIDAGGLTPGLVLGHGIADGNGVYAITSTALTQGAHALEVTAADEAGNVGAASAPLALMADVIVPDAPQAPQEVTISTPGLVGEPPKLSNVALANPDGDGLITTETTPVLSGRGLPGAAVTLYDTDGIATLGTVVIGTDARWSITASTLTDGLHKLTVTQTKAAGDASPRSAPLDLTVDTLPPLSPVITTLGGPIDSHAEHTTQVDVNGRAEPGSTVQLHVDMDNLVSGTATTASDGTYTIDGTVAPGVHKLTVIATDAAGNASQPSAVTLVTVAGAPPAPAGNATNLGKLIDGYIAGAAVFYDANGNGVLDANETASLSDAAGSFQLASSTATIVATGGVDTGTGDRLPGPLTAPPGSTVVTPLTTFLAAYATATGQTADAALAAVDVALGLQAGTDIRLLDPIAAAVAGHPAALDAGTRLMDTAVAFSAVIAGTGVSRSAAFTAVFQAMAHAAVAAPGPLNLSELSYYGQPVLTSILDSAFTAANPAGSLPAAAATDALEIVGEADAAIDHDFNTFDPAPAAYAQALETVVQGPVAAALLTAAADPTAIETIISNGGITDAVAAARRTQFLAAPRLTPASDTGASNQDNVTAAPAPVLTGTARPASLVLVLENDPYALGTFDVVGAGYADPNGTYSVAVTVQGLSRLFAIEAPAGQSGTIGAKLQLDVESPDPANVLTLVAPSAMLPYPALPAITSGDYVAANGDDAGHAALKIYGTLHNSPHESGGSIVSLYVDGGTTPVGTGIGNSVFGIVTPVLANGTHTLVVTQTFLDGTSQTSAPFTATVTAPAFVTTRIEAAGPVAGGQFTFDGAPAITTTGQDGSVSVPAGTVTIPESVVAHKPLQVRARYGVDTATGLPVPEPMVAPVGSAEIDPLTTVAGSFTGLTNPGSFNDPGPFSVALQESRAVAALGLPLDTDLMTADPLARAEAGNPALLVKSVEVLETATLLSPFIAAPFGIMPYSPTSLFTTSIDFTSAATITTWLKIGAYGNGAAGFQNAGSFDPSVDPAVAQIIAANNAAIEAEARTSTSPAATVAFLLADERFVQSVETPALNALRLDANNTSQQLAAFATATAADTGPNLLAAIAAQEGRTAQVTSFLPAGPASTTASTVDEIITFSQPVAGVTAADFTVHAAGLDGTRILGVAPISGSGGAQYDLTVQTGVGAGALTVSYTPDSTTPGAVRHVDGRALSNGQLDAPAFYADNSADGGGPGSIAIGDVDGDGIPDIVSANLYGLTVYRGLGGGQFAAQPPVATGGFGSGGSVLLADLNGDGKPDAVTLAQNNGTMSVLLNRGDGAFEDPLVTDAGTRPTSVVAGDFNGDGKTDLALVDYGQGTGATLRILLGKGDGTFTAGQVLRDYGYNGFGQLTAVDLNNDGKLDLIGTFSSNGHLPVLLGNGDGTFTGVNGPAVDNRGLSIAVGDLDRDGIPDVVLLPQSEFQGIPYNGTGSGTVLLGNGDGSFRAGSTVTVPSSELNGTNATITLGDVEGTGRLDLIVDSAAGIEVLPGNGDGTFAPATLATPAGAPVSQEGLLAIGDLNGDGLTDIVTGAQNTPVGGDYNNGDYGTQQGIDVYFGLKQTVLPATSAPLTIARAALAQPAIAQLSGPGTLIQSGAAYTLDLGTLSRGQPMQALTFALQNRGASPSDAFTGLFASPETPGFTVTGAALPAPVDAGQSYDGLAIAIDITTLGRHAQTITFAPRDQSATTTSYATLPGTDDVAATTTSVDGADVAAQLPPITLTITDTVAPSAFGIAVLQAPAAITLPNVRVGTSDTQALAVANTATAPAAVLDVAATATGAATVSGAVANLVPGASDTTGLVAGLATTQAGALAGTVALAPGSDSGSGPVPLPTATVAVSGKVFRTATAQIAPIALTLAVGDPGLIALDIRNTAAADGYSESLAASIGTYGPGLTAAGALSTGDIAAGTASAALAFRVDTSQSGTLTTSATIYELSDGGAGPGSIDGLGTLGLATIVLPVSVTIVAPPVAPAIIQAPASLVLPNARQGASDTLAIPVTNAATGPAALLDATATGAGNATTSGAVANLAAGGTASTLVAGLSTAQAGPVSGTVTLAAISDAGVGHTPLPIPGATVALSGTVYRTATAQAAPLAIVEHVGDSGTAPITLRNAANPDGYSEALAASIASIGPGLLGFGTASTGDIAPGGSSSALSIGFATSAPRKLSTSVTLIDLSDGGTGPGAIDGLGTAALAPIVVPVSLEIDSYAAAALALTVAGTMQTAAASRTIDLGSFAQGSGPVTISLAALNQALGQSDLLDGTLTAQGSLAAALSPVAGIAAGAAAAAGTLTLDTTTSGTVSDTLTFTPTSDDAAGTTALPTITLTLRATITPPAPPPVTGIQPYAALHLTGATQGVMIQASLLQPVAGQFTNLLGGLIEPDGQTYEDAGDAAQDQAALSAVTLLGATPQALGLAAGISGPGVLTDTGTAFSVLTTLSPDATAIAGPGNDRLVSAVGGTLVGGPDATAFFALAGPTIIQGGPGHDVVFAPAGDTTVTTGTAGSLVAFGTGRGTLTGHGADTIFGGAGPDTIVTAANSLVGLGSGPARVQAASGTTVIGGAGADTVSAAGTGAMFFTGAGPATFIGDASPSIVVGGSGSDTVDAGAGGGLFGAGHGGHSVLNGGTGASVLFGAAEGDLLVAQGAAGTVLAAGQGNETLQGGASSGNDTFYTGPGNDQVTLGSGHDTVLLGTGHATIAAGTGPDILAITKGYGTAITVTGWKPGVDAINLESYAPGEGIPATSIAGGATTVTFSDGATITFAGFDTLPARLFG